MKTLYLLRHAKSDWNDNKIDDVHRPLSKRGKRDCLLIAHELERQKRRFNTVYCSSAARARETLARFQAESTVFDGADINIEDALYTFETSALLNILKELPQELNSAVIIAHNPAIAELAEQLCDGTVGHVGTATFIELHANIEYWDQLRGDCAKLINIFRPKYFR